MGPHALLERLRQAVAQPPVGRHVGRDDGIEQAHGVPDRDGVRRGAAGPRQQILAGQLAMHRLGPDPQHVVAQHPDHVAPRETSGRVGQGALEQGGAEGRGETVEPEGGAAARTGRVRLLPDLEDRARPAARVEIRRPRGADGRELVGDVVAEGLGRILVEPLRRQVVGREPAGAAAVGRLHVHRQVEQREMGERDHPVAERQTRAQVAQVAGGGGDRERQAHGRASSVTEVA